MTFTPRPEFVRESGIPSDFALLSISSNASLRLFSFAPPVVAALRSLLDSWHLVATFREDVVQCFCEFTLMGKPWASPKNPDTESLLVHILSLLLQHNYTLRSSIDYGREPDDRLAIIFSRPFSPRLSRAISPQSTTTSIQEKEGVQLVPFAVSFVSSTVLRVLSPPLLSTPAILQAVRGSWPRGVVSEKKLGHNAFEFKLKGYKWFQEDTFADDSLKHILSLLSALDAHSFSLLTSLSLSSRSRIKDLWIFIGPGTYSRGSETSFSFSDSREPSLRPGTPDSSKFGVRIADRAHRQYATDPGPPVHTAAPKTPHPRALTESPLSMGQNFYTPSPRNSEYFRNSIISTKAQPITEEPQPEPLAEEMHSHPISLPTEDARCELTEEAEGDHHNMPMPPLMANGSDSSASPGPLTPPTPTELLASGVFRDFRDSAFSSSTELSADIPIKWTGPLNSKSPALARQESAAPNIPGAWQPTPIEEKAEQDLLDIQPDRTQQQPLRDVSERVNSPEFNEVGSSIRKSEVGIVGVLSTPELPPPSTEMSPMEDTNPNRGWVLVKVDGQENENAAAETNIAKDAEAKPAFTDSPEAIPSTPANGSPSPDPVSPVAKAIVIIDAVDARKKKDSHPRESKSSKRMRRFLSFSKKDTDKVNSKA